MFRNLDKYDISWFCKRYCALLVDFPMNLKSDDIAEDCLSLGIDPLAAVEALKAAHFFLAELYRELLTVPSLQDEQTDALSNIFLKIDLIWALCAFGKLCFQNGQSCIRFTKAVLCENGAKKTLPKSYPAAFRAIIENNCHVEFYKNDLLVKNYNNCDSGYLYFDKNSIIAEGLFLFVQKVLQKRWYANADKSKYAKSFTPITHFVAPFYRADMRVFTCGERLHVDIHEHLVGYSDEKKRCFDMLYHFVEEKHPDCLPSTGIYGYIHSVISYAVDQNHRMIGQLGLGDCADHFVFYSALSGKIKQRVLEEVDMTSIVRANICEDWFFIKNEADARCAIQIMDIQAKYNKNAGANAYISE